MEGGVRPAIQSSAVGEIYHLKLSSAPRRCPPIGFAMTFGGVNAGALDVSERSSAATSVASRCRYLLTKGDEHHILRLWSSAPTAI